MTGARSGLHVAVLMGGWSSEREISLASGAAVARALESEGYKVSRIDVGRDLAAQLSACAPDVVFNALHGPYGEDGCVQGLLEVMGLPYTHSGVAASALAMDKALAKTQFRAAGIRCADSRVISVEELYGQEIMPRPYVIKPVAEGSSVGVVIVREGENMAPPAPPGPWDAGARLMVERYVPGRELTVAVMDGRALGVLEIRAAQGFYDYRAKYTPGGSQHVIPAPLPGAVYEEARQFAVLAHQALGCAGVTRADLRYDEGAGDGLVLLEINTQPGMTPTSLVPEIAAHDGIGFGALTRWLVEDALCRA